MQGTVNSPGQEFRFWAESLGENAVKRAMGCVIMFAMPEEGVEEAISTLRDIYQFSTEATALALPAPTRRQRLPGKVVAKSERPALVISE